MRGVGEDNGRSINQEGTKMKGHSETLIPIIQVILIGGILLAISNETRSAGSLTSENINDAVSASYSAGGTSAQVNTELVNLDLSNHSRNDPDLPVATAVAPNLVANECLGSDSVAMQTGPFGFSGGSTKEHEKCNRRSNATVMWQGSEVSVNAGDIEMARRERHAARCVLAGDAEMKAAYEIAGIYCGDTVRFAPSEDAVALERTRRMEEKMALGWAGTKSGGYDFPEGN